MGDTSSVSIMPSTLSNQNGDEVVTNKLIPTYSDKEPIKWAGNPAHIDGILFEMSKHYKPGQGFFRPCSN